MVHCIHGKDRTGLVVMLLLLLCGVAHEVRGGARPDLWRGAGSAGALLGGRVWHGIGDKCVCDLAAHSGMLT